MPLPKIDLPIFELKLVSLAKPVRFRPFLVKEEKLLLMALQSQDDTEIYKTIKQIINNCLVDDLDIEKLPIFDIEYLFLNLRSRSIGENIETYFLCRNVVETRKEDDGTETEIECKHMMPVTVNILDIKPPIAELSPKVQITDKIGIVLKFPTLKSFKPITDMATAEGNEKAFEMIYECTDYVYDENGMYYAHESSKEEFYSFLESLTQEQYDRVLGFFENLPEIKYTMKHKCQKCNYDHDLVMEGLTDFFT